MREQTQIPAIPPFHGQIQLRCYRLAASQPLTRKHRASAHESLLHFHGSKHMRAALSPTVSPGDDVIHVHNITQVRNVPAIKEMQGRGARQHTGIGVGRSRILPLLLVCALLVVPSLLRLLLLLRRSHAVLRRVLSPFSGLLPFVPTALGVGPVVHGRDLRLCGGVVFARTGSGRLVLGCSHLVLGKAIAQECALREGGAQSRDLEYSRLGGVIQGDYSTVCAVQRTESKGGGGESNVSRAWWWEIAPDCKFAYICERRRK